ncbi:hypothetical protein [Streptomyces sp. NPDC005408]|uniref:hypothetical protein n=1 Tax=Streptomyces sp. NPDC005408 TaxID=3155341 RepID=UPI0033A43B29
MSVDDRGRLGRDAIVLSARDPFAQEHLVLHVTAQATEQMVVEQMPRGVVVVVREMGRKELGLVR